MGCLTPQDRVALAFSGGGIRSATFNLGVLQGLQRLKLLRHFDYLATVSGGGYVGAWWSVWLSRRPQNAGIFPGHDSNGDPRLRSDKTAGDVRNQKQETREPEEVRHLREFSNFLSPRLGFFETEMWSAILAVVSAMLPALLVALAVVAGALLLCLGLAVFLMSSVAPGGAIVALISTTLLILFVQVIAELNWCGKKKAEVYQFPVAWWRRTSLIGILAVVAAWGLVRHERWLESDTFPEPRPWSVHQVMPADEQLWEHFGIRPGADWSTPAPAKSIYDPAPFKFDRRLFHRRSPGLSPRSRSSSSESSRSGAGANTRPTAFTSRRLIVSSNACSRPR